jgi:RimJ/RimL family protein N-acetyltransferase
MEPILINIPSVIETERLLLRHPQADDGRIVNEAIHESFAMLEPWMPWARTLPSVEESEAFVRRKHAQWILREELMLLIFDRTQKSLIGCTGFHSINWCVPRFEIGYWIRSSCQGRGFIKESTATLTQFAFGALSARRIEIRCDTRNVRSANVPQRLGYRLEAVLQNDSLDASGQQLRDAMVFARVDAEDLPNVKASW